MALNIAWRLDAAESIPMRVLSPAYSSLSGVRLVAPVLAAIVAGA